MTPANGRLLDVRTAAQRLGVCANTLRSVVGRGELPSLKIGARRLVDIVDLDRYIEARKEVAQ
ncbi:MAG: helix-turn-helix domain-containing protein [Phycisphaerales bacterium]|nr:helix-turn-helix domain-containing protein [Phycisphaerales bacterium]